RGHVVEEHRPREGKGLVDGRRDVVRLLEQGPPLSDREVLKPDRTRCRLICYNRQGRGDGGQTGRRTHEGVRQTARVRAPRRGSTPAASGYAARPDRSQGKGATSARSLPGVGRAAVTTGTGVDAPVDLTTIPLSITVHIQQPCPAAEHADPRPSRSCPITHDR